MNGTATLFANWKSEVKPVEAVILDLLDTGRQNIRQILARCRRERGILRNEADIGIILKGMIERGVIERTRTVFNITLEADTLRAKPRTPSATHDEWVE